MARRMSNRQLRFLANRIERETTQTLEDAKRIKEAERQVKQFRFRRKLPLVGNFLSKRAINIRKLKGVEDNGG